ncbi:MAG: hypothetical protein JXN61_01920 [Sedimentisphaerales bacterium]|nr:hypothetical protein [Sedimentisphaerales bacterium]
MVAAEWFFDFMFRAKIALRGCLNYGRFYADRVKRIYYGTGLIEAYELAESQDWIGFVLSEKAQNRMSECRTKTNRTCWDACKSHYIEYDVPLSTKGAYHNKRRLPAYKICFHSGEPESMRSDDYFRFVLMLDSSRYEIEHGPGLSEQDRAELRAGVRRKYENTDRFLSKVYPEIDQNLHNQFRDSLYY